MFHSSYASVLVGQEVRTTIGVGPEMNEKECGEDHGANVRPGSLSVIKLECKTVLAH